MDYSTKSNEYLVRTIQDGEDVENNLLRLWQQNKGLISLIIMKYQGLAELDDLRQEAFLALAEAAKNYRSDGGASFATYYSYYLKAACTRWIDNNGTIRIPVSRQTKIKKYHKLVADFTTRCGRTPTRAETCSLLGITLDDLEAIQAADQQTELRSLDSPIRADEDLSVADTIPDVNNPIDDLIESVYAQGLQKVLTEIIDTLPERQRDIIYSRFITRSTFKEISKQTGLTISQIRNVEDKALKNLRMLKNRQKLLRYLGEEYQWIYSQGLRGTSLGAFRNSFTSATERAALRLYERHEQLLDEAKTSLQRRITR